LKEWIIQYHRHGKPIPEGFERHDGLDDTHHGHHACLAVMLSADVDSAADRAGDIRADKTPALASEIPPGVGAPLCQCGQPLKTEDRSHGIFTLCCGRQLESCCGE
jgi:hypothetical protein